MSQLDEVLQIVHDSLFFQLKDIDRVCRANNIEYSLVAGTLLGAVRCGDFIPWDDDADIVMTRENFEKFDRIYPFQKDSCLTYEYDEGQWVKRVGNKNPIVYDGNNYSRVSTDIFIFDNSPDSVIFRRLKIFVLQTLQGMMKIKPDYKKYGLFGKIASFVTQCAGKILPTNVKLSAYESISKLGSNKKKGYVWYYNGAYSYLSLVINKNYIEEYIDYPFMNASFRLFKHHHEYLSLCYGENYLQPPPAAMRVPSHMYDAIYKFDLVNKNNKK